VIDLEDMILSIHQPSYFPWLGLLDKIRNSDVFMVMDEVQLSDSGYQHRNLFLTADGHGKFLTIPLVKKDYLRIPLREIRIAAQDWRSKHLNFIRQNYGRHPFAREIMPPIEDYFAADYERLIDAAMASMQLTFRLFRVDSKVIFQSDMTYDRSLRRGDMVVALARAAGADCYLSGTGARAYLDESAFSDLTVRFRDFTHPTYPQHRLGEFCAGLSSLDALFNLGADGARALLGQRASAQ
jgi:WbqC-like protein family